MNSSFEDLGLALFEHAPIAGFVLNPQLEILEINRAAEALLGQVSQQLQDQSFIAILDARSHSKAALLFDHLSKIDSIELNLVTAQRMITVQARSIHIHERYLVLLQPVFDSIPIAERMIQLTQRLQRLSTIATSAVRMIGLPHILDHILELTLQEFGCCAGAVFEQIEPESSDMWRLLVQRGWGRAWLARMQKIQALPPWSAAHLETTTALYAVGKHDKLGLIKGDLPATVGPWCHVVATPLRSNTLLIGWLYVVSDRYQGLSEQDREGLQTVGNMLGPLVQTTRLQQQVHQRSSQLHSLLSTINNGVVLVDEHNIVQYVNPTLGSLIQEPVQAWQSQPFAETTLYKHMQVAQAHPVLGSLMTLPGTPPRILQYVMNHMFDNAGMSTGQIYVFQDVTPIVSMQELQNDFISAAAHDLKTPVTTIKGYTQIALILAQKSQHSELYQQLKIIDNQTDTLVLLMDSILDISRLQANQLILNLSEGSLTKLIQSALKFFELDLQRNQQAFELLLPEQDLVVYWDHQRMIRVLINLLENSFKYSRNQGQVTLQVQVDPDSEVVTIHVQDQGIGIPDHEHEHIWKRFYRGIAVVDAGFRGTGIGLYLVKSIIDLHNGTVEIYPQVAAPGTHIMCRLPRSIKGTEA